MPPSEPGNMSGTSSKCGPDGFPKICMPRIAKRENWRQSSIPIFIDGTIAQIRHLKSACRPLAFLSTSTIRKARKARATWT